VIINFSRESLQHEEKLIGGVYGYITCGIGTFFNALSKVKVRNVAMAWLFDTVFVVILLQAKCSTLISARLIAIFIMRQPMLLLCSLSL
jgi:hypothetical protein